MATNDPGRSTLNAIHAASAGKTLHAKLARLLRGADIPMPQCTAPTNETMHAP